MGRQLADHEVGRPAHAAVVVCGNTNVFGLSFLVWTTGLSGPASASCPAGPVNSAHHRHLPDRPADGVDPFGPAVFGGRTFGRPGFYDALMGRSLGVFFP